ncbi:hypothetical protein CBF34_09970 [Vagococcus penaei]|uniref:Uncharacterized protein n=1 Tax=Vagococcus penaei TaxID=633807 RepID=A0A1Q2D4B0_9ENTE|nr:CAP-associated domain-containing protein [Vagococcus penaei]AQP53240.1 hypothetical protein BW732_02650 [Vagococcus penaei]RST98686.1 hypothetical protein CBF34_09970 [Vagococcus penaei]
MKRFWQFVICFILVLIAVYMKPVITSQKIPQEKHQLEVTESSFQPANMAHTELNTSGMANDIGKTEDEWLKKYPNPKKSYQSALGIKWLVYGDDLDDFFEVGIKNSRVTNIFVLGHQLDTAPFQIDMNLSDLSEITTIFSSFLIKQDGKNYRMELTEDDMNYRPLISFNNGTFAMLHLNQINGKLIAIRYLDKESLLDLMPYTSDDQNMYQAKIAENLDWSVINEDNRQQTLQLLNLLRSSENKSAYVFDVPLQEKTTKAIELFNQAPNKVLTTDEQQDYWQRQKDRVNHSTPFGLTSQEMDSLFKEARVNKKTVHGLFYHPATDIPFMISSLYGSRSYHEELLHNSDKYIGISFQKNSMLMLFSQDKETSATIKTQESSGE